MNAHQRRKYAAEKHMRMPLGSAVLVRKLSGQYEPAKMFKHENHGPHRCIVEFPNGEHRWVSLYSVKPARRLKVRPWWRVHRENVMKGKA